MISRVYKVLGSEDRLSLFLLLSSGISGYDEVTRYLRTLSSSSMFKFYNEFIATGLTQRRRGGEYELTHIGNIVINTIRFFGDETKRIREDSFKQEAEGLMRRYGLGREDARRIINSE